MSSQKPLNKNIIELEKVSVVLGGQNIVSNISFSIKEGEIVALIGPNGAGKTTLVKAMLGLVPYFGKIKIFGKDPFKIRGKIGYVPQNFVFDRDFPITLIEFLNLSAGSSRHKDIKKILEEVGMDKKSETLLGSLSGGELQRVLIARALLKEPEILFLDEPTAGIDIEGEKSFYELIQDLNKSKKTTIIMVSHEISMVYKFATQVVCLNRDLFCFGRPKEAITREVLSRIYKNFELKSHKH